MHARLIPGWTAIAALATIAGIALAALLLRAPVRIVLAAAVGALLATAALGACDCFASLRQWRNSCPRMTRRMPAAFAIGVTRPITLAFELQGDCSWHCEIHDHADPSLATDGLPIRLTLDGGRHTEATYTVVPTARGEVAFGAADLRIRSRWGLCELIERLGARETRRVFPDFAQVARYAWLAGDRRLQDIGVKTYQLRGQGTDFKQLSEYRVGDPVRHIDWRATLRMDKPIVREFQDERDQFVILMVDCGRRMRADDRQGPTGTTHFDQVLNAVMLLSYVALKQGDAVGGLTFGTPRGGERSFAPQKGVRAFNALMGELYDAKPSPAHSDYVSAARQLLSVQHKRALVILITNFRDEDNAELGHALRLLRSRHLVLLASLRERVVNGLIDQPLVSGDTAIEVASAHAYEQSRRDAFNRLAARDAFMVDADPEQLGIALVNRYHAVKRAGLI